MHFPLYLLIPAVSAVVYTVSSLLHKRGYDSGAGTLQTFHWANLIGMPFFLPMFFVKPEAMPLHELWRPAFTAALIYLGSWSTFAAVKRGDVSMVTPILGTKVVFVALGNMAIAGQHLSTALWIAAALATLGVMVIGKADWKPGRAGGVAVLLCLGSAFFFGLTDVLIGMWAVKHGGTTFLAGIPQFIGLFSLLAVAFSPRPVLRLPRPAARWVIWGGLLLAAQGMAMGVALAFFNDTTGVNILYSTRGMWSLVLVWFAGAWFANRERHHAGRATMLWRLAGTLLIFTGVILAVLSAAQPPAEAEPQESRRPPLSQPPG